MAANDQQGQVTTVKGTLQIARVIQACGYHPGDKVGILAPNIIEAFIALRGIYESGDDLAEK